MLFISDLNQLSNMNDNRILQLIIVTSVLLILFSAIDFAPVILNHQHVTLVNVLSYKLFAISIPVLFVASAIIKLIYPYESFERILLIIYAPILIWGFIIFLEFHRRYPPMW